MKKRFKKVLCIVFAILLLQINFVYADNEQDSNVWDYFYNCLFNNDCFVLNDESKNISDIVKDFMRLGLIEDGSELYEFVDLVNGSIVMIEHNNAILPYSFETKNASQTFADNFVYNVMGVDRPLRFSTTISATISYNSNTYEVNNVYSEKMTTTYVGNYVEFANFYASGYSITSSISNDRSNAKVIGRSNLYVDENYGTAFPNTVNMKTISHTLTIAP